jgi:hypothetical protein
MYFESFVPICKKRFKLRDKGTLMLVMETMPKIFVLIYDHIFIIIIISLLPPPRGYVIIFVYLYVLNLCDHDNLKQAFWREILHICLPFAQLRKSWLNLSSIWLRIEREVHQIKFSLLYFRKYNKCVKLHFWSDFLFS